MQGKNIVLVSPEPWGVNLLSKHSYALALALLGNKVWFIEPSQNIGSGRSKIIKDNLIVITPDRLLRGKNMLPAVVSRFFNKIEIGWIKKITGKPDIVWSFDPYRFQWLKDFNATYAIYHPVDLHPNAKRVSVLLHNADFVFTPSNSLISSEKQVYLIPHGVITGKSVFDTNILNRVKDKHIKACYVGNFYNLLDFAAIHDLVAGNQDVGFVFIGPIGASNLGEHDNSNWIQMMMTKGNCVFTGELPIETINSILEVVDINFVVYKQPQINSHKILTYLLSGKVTLTTPIGEYVKNPFVETVKTSEAFLARFKYIKNNIARFNCIDLQRGRKLFAEGFEYDKLINLITKIVFDGNKID